MRLPTFDQWNALCDELAEIVEGLRRNGPELLRFVKHQVRDSYPTRTPGSQDWGGAPSSTVDKDGVPMPPVSDRVGDIVVNMLDNPVHREVEKMAGITVQARNQLRLAEKARIDAADAAWPPPAEPKVDKPTVPGCVIHARFGLYEAQRAMGRCRWCNDFRADHDGRDPTDQEIQALTDLRVRKEMQRAEQQRAA